jgi:hypothetical protein
MQNARPLQHSLSCSYARTAAKTEALGKQALSNEYLHCLERSKLTDLSVPGASALPARTATRFTQWEWSRAPMNFTCLIVIISMLFRDFHSAADAQDTPGKTATLGLPCA